MEPYHEHRGWAHPYRLLEMIAEVLYAQTRAALDRLPAWDAAITTEFFDLELARGLLNGKLALFVSRHAALHKTLSLVWGFSRSSLYPAHSGPSSLQGGGRRCCERLEEALARRRRVQGR